MHPSMGLLPIEGCRLLLEVKLSRRHYHRALRPHTPSHPRRPRPLPASHHKHAIKRATMRDCGRRCVYCATPLEFSNATLDHVYPLAHGGAHTLGNLVAACSHCNRLKGQLLPVEFFMRNPWAGLNFITYARAVHRALKRCARRAVSLAYARAA
jgi:5-methylcytosine-specific restriction endonuclease McrA